VEGEEVKTAVGKRTDGGEGGRSKGDESEEIRR
jgi:hypothetical protein